MPSRLLSGYWSYQKVKEINNIVRSRDTVRKEMRYLGHCYLHVLNSTPKTLPYNYSKDTFLISNFAALKEAIDKYCCEENELKAGRIERLKNHVNSLLKKTYLNYVIIYLQ